MIARAFDLPVFPRFNAGLLHDSFGIDSPESLRRLKNVCDGGFKGHIGGVPLCQGDEDG
jgi:hypothetical protein